MGGVINWATYAIFVSVSALVFAHPVIGVAAGSLAGLVVNFTLSRRFVFGTEAGVRRVDWTLVALPLISLAVMLGSKVNPWPRDGWFETQYFLFGHYPGYDNYAPVSAPALLFRMGHVIAVALGLDLAGEFYIGVVLQNLLVLLSAYFVYLTLKAMRFTALAGPVAIGFLLCVLSTNLPQAFYSESTVVFLMAAVMLVVVLLPEAGGGPKFWGLTADWQRAGRAARAHADDADLSDTGDRVAVLQAHAADPSCASRGRAHCDDGAAAGGDRARQSRPLWSL